MKNHIFIEFEIQYMVSKQRYKEHRENQGTTHSFSSAGVPVTEAVLWNECCVWFQNISEQLMCLPI